MGQLSRSNQTSLSFSFEITYSNNTKDELQPSVRGYTGNTATVQLEWTYPVNDNIARRETLAPLELDLIISVLTTRDIRCRLPNTIVSVSYFYLSLLYWTKTRTVVVNHFGHSPSRRMASHLICSPYLLRGFTVHVAMCTGSTNT